jgi:hypothetical protein
MADDDSDSSFHSGPDEKDDEETIGMAERRVRTRVMLGTHLSLTLSLLRHRSVCLHTSLCRRPRL